MNKKIVIISIIIGASILASVVSAQFSFAQNKQVDAKQIVLKMTSSKDVYLRGEPIQLFGEYINNSNQDVLIHEGKTTVIGIAKEGEDFIWYDANPTDCSRSSGLPLMSGQSIKTDSQLYNFKKSGVFLLNATAPKPPSPLMDCRNLKGVENIDCAVKNNEQQRADFGKEIYAFEDVGTYYAKYGGSVVIDEKANKSEPIKTEPVKIQIVEPEGEDLEVWKIINDENKTKFVSLMRDGWVDSRNQEAKDSFIKEVEQILLEHPNSIYSEYLRNGLDNFRTVEAKKDAEKLKAQQKQKQPN